MKYRSRTEQRQEYRPIVVILSNSIYPLWYLEKAHRKVRPDFDLNLEPIIMDLDVAYEKCKDLARREFFKVIWIIELEHLLSVEQNKGICHEDIISRIHGFVSEFQGNRTVSIVINNPSYEIWLQLHFEKLGDSFLTNGNVVQSSLNKYLPGYKRDRSFYHAEDDIYLKTYQYLPIANANASSLVEPDFPELRYARTMMPLIMTLFI